MLNFCHHFDTTVVTTHIIIIVLITTIKGSSKPISSWNPGGRVEKSKAARMSYNLLFFYLSILIIMMIMVTKMIIGINILQLPLPLLDNFDDDPDKNYKDNDHEESAEGIKPL